MSLTVSALAIENGPVPKRRHGAGEEHRAEPRERVVAGLLEPGRLDVADGEADVRNSGLTRFGDRGLDHPLGDVHAVRGTARPDQLRQADGRITKAAADVEHPIALAR